MCPASDSTGCRTAGYCCGPLFNTVCECVCVCARARARAQICGVPSPVSLSRRQPPPHPLPHPLRLPLCLPPPLRLRLRLCLPSRRLRATPESRVRGRGAARSPKRSRGRQYCITFVIVRDRVNFFLENAAVRGRGPRPRDRRGAGEAGRRRLGDSGRRSPQPPLPYPPAPPTTVGAVLGVVMVMVVVACVGRGPACQPSERVRRDRTGAASLTRAGGSRPDVRAGQRSKEGMRVSLCLRAGSGISGRG